MIQSVRNGTLVRCTNRCPNNKDYVLQVNTRPPGEGGNPQHLEMCKGVVTHEDFVSESEEHLKCSFEPQGVENVHRILRKVDSIFVPSILLFLFSINPLFLTVIRAVCSTFECGSDGNHGSNSRGCPKFQVEREVQTISATDKVSFLEAGNRYRAQHLVDLSRSFVSVLMSSKSTTTCSETVRSYHSKVLCQNFYHLQQ